MVEKYAQNMGEKQKRLFNDFVKICIYATDEEFDALLEMRPVDYGMFKSLSEHLIEMGADTSFFKLHERYPKYAKRYGEEIENEISNITFPKMTAEEEKRMKEELYEKIRKLYGDDAV